MNFTVKLPYFEKWVSYPRFSKCLSSAWLSYTIWHVSDDMIFCPQSSLLMWSSYNYCARDGLQQLKDVLVCFEGALIWCDGLVPNTIPSVQSKAFLCFLDLWHQHFVKEGKVLSLSADHFMAWVSLELKESFSCVLTKRGDCCRRYIKKMKKITVEVQDPESNGPYYSRIIILLLTGFWMANS